MADIWTQIESNIIEVIKAASEPKLGDSSTYKRTISVKKLKQKSISASGNSTSEKAPRNLFQKNDDQTHFVTEKSDESTGDNDLLWSLTHEYQKFEQFYLLSITTSKYFFKTSLDTPLTRKT